MNKIVSDKLYNIYRSSNIILLTTFCSFISLFITLLLIDWTPSFNASIAYLSIFLIISFPLFPKILQEVKKSRLYGLPSYVNISIAPIAIAIAITISPNFAFITAFIGIVSFSAILILYKMVKPLNLFTLKRHFASGAVKKDELGFKRSICNSASAIKELNNYVSIAALYGGCGEGKSSFARMVIEQLPADQFLYTYISLTEANQANDFSKLFAERWFKTLAERYPIINHSNLNALNSILRDIPNYGSIASSMVAFLSAINFGLIATRSKIWDKEFMNKNSLDKEYSKSSGIDLRVVNKNIAKMFSYIPSIQEESWVIMIDEIERGELDEVYHVIEIIERFKNEGRFGLPIKLVFILCISQDDLKNKLEKYKYNHEKAWLIDGFFSSQPKSIDLNIFLPPIPEDIRIKFVKDSLNRALTNSNAENISEEMEHVFSSPSDESLKFYGGLNEQQSLAWLLQQIIYYETPRQTDKLCLEIEFFYNGFIDDIGNHDTTSIAICDVIAICYAKIKYPILIDFFTKVSSNENSYLVNEEVSDGEKLSDNQKNINRIIKKIESITGIKVESNDKEKVANLALLIHNPAVELDEINHAKRTQHPDCLRSILSLTPNHDILRNKETYESVHEEKLATISNKDLIDYSKSLRKISANHSQTDDYQKLIEVTNELFKRMENNKISPTPSRPNSDSIYSEANYQFLLTISRAIEMVPQNQQSTKIKEIWKILKTFLISKTIYIESKYVILNGLANEYRGKGSETHSKLHNNFNKIIDIVGKTSVKKIIKVVINDAKNRYFIEKNKVYECEENPSYVLYQSWNGTLNDKNLHIIQSHAEELYKKYPEYLLKSLNNFSPDDYDVFKIENIAKKSKAWRINRKLKEDIQNALTRFLKGRKDFEDGNYHRSHLNGKYFTLMHAMIKLGYIDSQNKTNKS